MNESGDERPISGDVSTSRDGRRAVSPWISGFIGAAISGALLGVCFPPFDLHFVAWFALVPWLLALRRLSASMAWLLGSCVGLVFFRIVLSWMFGIHGLLAGIVVLILSLLMGLSFRVSKLLAIRFGDRALLWSIPFTFVGQEVLRSEALGQLRISYGAFGYSQACNLFVAQIASLGGAYFVSFLLIGVNCALVDVFARWRLSACWPVAVVGGLMFGLGQLSSPTDHVRGAGIPVACVQAESEDDRAYVELTRQAANLPIRPAIIVLPEHTIDGFADRLHPFVEKLSAIAREFRFYICVGAHFHAPAGLACEYDNVALLLGPDGERIGAQCKSVPVPFFHDGNPARSQCIFPTPLGKIGMCVCFDTDFTDVPRRVVDMGAELLLVPVMNPDNWPSQQRFEQSAMAQFRSIELRRWAVRAASSGISQIVEGSGRVRAERLQASGPGILTGTVHANSERTLFVRGGFLFAQLVGVAYAIAVLVMTIVSWGDAIRNRKRVP